MAEWLKAAVLKTVSRRRDVGSNPTPSAFTHFTSLDAGMFASKCYFKGEMAELVEGARLLSE